MKNFYFKTYSKKWGKGVSGTCQTCSVFTHFLKWFLAVKWVYRCPTALRLCQNVGDMDGSFCQKLGSLDHIKTEIQTNVTSDFWNENFMKKFDKFEYKAVLESKTFVSKGGFITQNHASSQNLSSLGGQKPWKKAVLLFFYGTLKNRLSTPPNEHLRAKILGRTHIYR